MLDSRENYKFDLGVEGSRETDESPFKSARLKKLLALHITGTKTKNALSGRRELGKKSLTIK